jgi:hypothetical protein
MLRLKRNLPSGKLRDLQEENMTWKTRFVLPTILCLTLIPAHPESSRGQTDTSSAQHGADSSYQGAGGQAQEEILNNDSIIQLLKIGLDDDTIIAKIQKTKHNFDMSTQGLVALKQAGASNRLIQFMISPAQPAQKAASQADASPAQPSVIGSLFNPAASLPTEIGVYTKKDDRWAEIQPEVVNWKTGGVLKRVATVGIVKGDVNGNINGPHSRNEVKTPIEFIIVTAEGVAITEYQLIHLNENKDDREFRTVTGGVFHSSGGATRDLLQFEGTKLASRTFSVKLTSMGAGEYGFLPPGVAVAGNSSGTQGKMYTFRIAN